MSNPSKYLPIISRLKYGPGFKTIVRGEGTAPYSGSMRSLPSLVSFTATTDPRFNPYRSAQSFGMQTKKVPLGVR